MITKMCIVCEEHFPATNEYFHRRGLSKDGLRTDCKKCRKEKKLKGFRPLPTRKCSTCNIEKPNNSEYFHIRNNYKSQRTRSICKDCHSEYYRFHGIKKKYNLSKDEYNLMCVEQNYNCAICKMESKRLVVDHCHTTGEVRKLLCDTCNTGLGMFKDNEEILKKAAEYLITHNSRTNR